MTEKTTPTPDRDQLIASIITAATTRTFAGTLNWTHSRYSETFTTQIGNNNLTVSRLSKQRSLTIADEKHETIAQVHEYEEEDDTVSLAMLHRLARENANRTNGKLALLLQELEKTGQPERPDSLAKESPQTTKGLLARLPGFIRRH